MKILKILFLLLVSFFLSSCDCSCYDIDTNLDTNVVTTQSTLNIYADACASSSGIITNGYPTGSCDGTGQYVNRGKWVQIPNIIPAFNTKLTINTYGSMYFCSTGYDTQVSPTPKMIITPSNKTTYLFSNNESIPVVPGQQIMVNIAYDNSLPQYQKGVALSNNSTSITNSCSNVSSDPTTNYNSFLLGNCRGYYGYGLTIYVGDTKLVRLDEVENQNDENGFYTAESRTPNLYAYIPSNDTSGFYSVSKSHFGVDISSANYGNYVFIVPPGLKGDLGFRVQAKLDPRGSQNAQQYLAGTGSYTITVNSTPPACYVQNANAENTPGNRGGIDLVVSSSNPNDYDDAVGAFDALNNGNEMNVYYPELVSYINAYSGISTSGTALTGLVVDTSVINSVPPVIITTSSYVVDTVNHYGSNVWVKVRDDYYSDNVGSYYLDVSYSIAASSSVGIFIDNLINPIVASFRQLSQLMYSNFNSFHFLNIVRMSLLIYIIVFGIQFMLGLVRISLYDLLFRIIKIGVVVELFDVAHSWSFFDAYFFELFKNGMDRLIQYVTGDYSGDKANIFSFVDQMFQIFFTKQTWTKILALFFDAVGIIYMFQIIHIMSLYILILARVIVSYLLVIIGVALLTSLAPIFFVLMLFQKTKRYFDNWISHLVDYALQPILNFGIFYLITTIFLTFWDNLMDFEVCWGSVIHLYFDYLYKHTNGFIPIIDFQCLTFYAIKGGPNLGELFMGISVISMFTYAMKNVMSFVPSITQSISGVSSSLKVTQFANEAIQRATDTIHKGLDTIGTGFKKGANFASNTARKLSGKDGGGNGE